MTVSKHFMEERADRYAFIATTIGVGRIIHSYKQEYSKYAGAGVIVNITTTGIAMINTIDDDRLVTMYVLTLNEAKKYYNDNIPFAVEAIIKSNMRKKYHLLQNEIKY